LKEKEGGNGIKSVGGKKRKSRNNKTGPQGGKHRIRERRGKLSEIRKGLLSRACPRVEKARKRLKNQRPMPSKKKHRLGRVRRRNLKPSPRKGGTPNGQRRKTRKKCRPHIE